jgi:hypothetical protein
MPQVPPAMSKKYSQLASGDMSVSGAMLFKTQGLAFHWRNDSSSFIIKNSI